MRRVRVTTRAPARPFGLWSEPDRRTYAERLADSLMAKAKIFGDWTVNDFAKKWMLDLINRQGYPDKLRDEILNAIAEKSGVVL